MSILCIMKVKVFVQLYFIDISYFEHAVQSLPNTWLLGMRSYTSHIWVSK
jgi:hypothetical protein